MSRADDTNQLVDDGIVFAEELLVKHGEFIPFGMVMLADGTTQMVAADIGEEQPESQPVIDFLKEAMRAQASEDSIRCSAIFYEVATKLPGSGDPADAIAAAVDHRENYSVIVLYPYQVQGEQIAYADCFANAGAGDIFS